MFLEPSRIRPLADETDKVDDAPEEEDSLRLQAEGRARVLGRMLGEEDDVREVGVLGWFGRVLRSWDRQGMVRTSERRAES